MHTFNQAWSAVTFQNLFKCKLEATKTQGHSFTDSSFFRAFGWSIGRSEEVRQAGRKASWV
jgi:hypothetical protein